MEEYQGGEFNAQYLYDALKSLQCWKDVKGRDPSLLVSLTFQVRV